MSGIRADKRLIPLVAAILAQVALGFALLWSGAAPLLAKHLDSAPSGVSSVFPWFTTAYTLGVLAAGQVIPRKGLLVLPIGGLLAASGYLTVALGDSLTHAYLGFAGLTGIGTGLAYMALVKIGRSLMPHHPGAGGGAVLAGYGLGALCWSGVISLVNDPEPLLFSISGAITALTLVAWALARGAISQDAIRGTEAYGIERFKLFPNPVFWRILGNFLIITTTGLMVIGNAHTIASGAIPGKVGAGILLASVMSLGSGIGRISAGAMGDRYGLRPTYLTVLLVLCGGFLGLSAVHGLIVPLVSGFAIGWGFGGGLSLLPGMCDGAFGKGFGTQAFGYAFVGYAIGSIIGRNGFMWSHGATGSVVPVLMGSAIVCASAFAFELWRPVRYKHV